MTSFKQNDIVDMKTKQILSPSVISDAHINSLLQENIVKIKI